MVSHTRCAGHLEPFDQPGELAGERVPNDHSNTEYDDEVIGRLGDLHERFEPILASLIGGDPRLRCYEKKLTEALDKAEDGAVEREGSQAPWQPWDSPAHS